MRSASSGARATASGRSSRSSTGTRSASRRTSMSTRCRTTRCTTPGTRRSAAFPVRDRSWSVRTSVRGVGAAPTRSSAEFTRKRSVLDERRAALHLRARASGDGPQARRRFHGLVHRPERRGQDDDRAHRRARDRGARTDRRVPRRRHGADPSVERPRLLEGGPRREHRADRMGGVPADAPRRGRDRICHLPVRGGACARAHDGRGLRPIRRGVRRRLARRGGAPGHEGPLREGDEGRDPELHRRQRPLREAGAARHPHRLRYRVARAERAADRRAARGAWPDPRRGGRVTVATKPHLIAPHGGELVDRTGEPPHDLEALETLTLTSRELSDLDLIASGALSPLDGFMGSDDYEAVLDAMRLANGLPWALPVCLAVDSPPRSDRVALADESGHVRGVLDVMAVYTYIKEREAEAAFRTTDAAHPGVARLYRQKELYLAGPVTVFDRSAPSFPELALDPVETRAEFERRGWKRVVGFQTRNPIHRAHEYLTKVALETVDGLLIHPLVGETKSDDVPAATRVECYRVLLDGYYPANRVVLSAFPAAMRYAGPREAIWHAICRKNYGCSHFIVGRDHAGVGDYY